MGRPRGALNYNTFAFWLFFFAAAGPLLAALAPWPEPADARGELRVLRLLGLPLSLPDPDLDGDRLHRRARRRRVELPRRAAAPAGGPAGGERGPARAAGSPTGELAVGPAATADLARMAGTLPHTAARVAGPARHARRGAGATASPCPSSTACPRRGGARPSSSSAWWPTWSSWGSSSTSTSSPPASPSCWAPSACTPRRARCGLLLPAGISFYTFQAMSYTIDIYRGECKPTDELRRLRAVRLLLPPPGGRARSCAPTPCCPR